MSDTVPERAPACLRPPGPTGSSASMNSTWCGSWPRVSNAEMAARLYRGEAIVKSHVARVLAKLDLRDRVQVAVYAYEYGIVRPGYRSQSR